LNIARLDNATSQLPLWSERDSSGQWVVRESRRARRLTVRVFHSGHVEVVVPPRTSHGAVERFVARHRNWIERKRSEARREAPAPEVFPPQQIDFSACNESWRVHLAGGLGRLRVASSEGLLIISGDASNPKEMRQVLRRWLIKRAAEVLGGALAARARELDFQYQRVAIRRQRTRWGSCSTRGTISLNCCLLFQRPPVMDYLLIHELAHTRHMNHSRRFWQCVADHCPEYEHLDRELLTGWRRVPTWVFGDGV
jgi:predicted metal-dependent hydrolase